MKIVFAFASRSRPQRFFSTLDNIFSLCRTDVFVSAAIDADDFSMCNKEVLDRMNSYGEKVRVNIGISKNKVDAINRSAQHLPECDIIIAQSDDMTWLINGFDELIISAMIAHFPDTDGFLHFFDGKQKNTSTLNIVGKKYFDRMGAIYHKDFGSVYCDNYETEKAKHLGKYKFINSIIFEHRHPIHRKTDWDELYKKNEHPNNYRDDRIVFDRLMKELNNTNR